MGGALGSPGCRRAQKHWNVLVIVPDTVRADHLSINGYDRNTSPHLDALARDGTNFTQAITAAPRTYQSFSSILTGLYPPHHGVRYIFDKPIDRRTPTLATVLQQAGYHTAVFDRLTFVRGMTGGAGFETLVGPDSHPGVLNSEQNLVDEAWKWIDGSARQPFFAFVRLSGAHWPYRPDPEVVAEFDPCDGRDHSFNEGGYGIGPRRAPGGGVGLVDKEMYRKRFFDYSYDARTLAHMTAHYDALIRETDTALGGLFDRMRAAGLFDDTIIVVTSDHGESLGEHGYLQHGPRVDEPVLRVPLIVRLPRGHAARRPGTTVTQLVRTVDIFPTVLAALALPTPQNLDGVDLLPALAGKPVPRLWAYAESGQEFMGVDPELHVEGVKGKHRAIRQERWKLIFIPHRDGGENRLFDLRADPGERRNLAGERPEKVKELRLLLDSVLASDEDTASRVPKLTPEQVEQLRALGYM